MGYEFEEWLPKPVIEEISDEEKARRKASQRFHNERKLAFFLLGFITGFIVAISLWLQLD